MDIVTSIGPKRTVRQQQCISSWLRTGCNVTAVQTIGESSTLSRLYPDVKFIETDLVGDVFNRPNLVRIKAILNLATEDKPILILNSDIEICSPTQTPLTPFSEVYREFHKDWEIPPTNVLRMGIRWNRDPDTADLSILKYGIDAFLITKQIADDLDDIGMTMGCPAWDYWIPIALQRKGYALRTSKAKNLVHDTHHQNWNNEDFRTGVALLSRYYNLTLKEASAFILRVTEREA